MVKRSGFERGDIVRVSFNPTVGREMQGDMRPHWCYPIVNLITPSALS